MQLLENTYSPIPGLACHRQLEPQTGPLGLTEFHIVLAVLLKSVTKNTD